MIGIYKITNNINNKIYIGQSKNIEKRWQAHKTRPFNPNNDDYNKVLYRAIRKYGLENFSFEIIEECSQEKLNIKENYWIKQYQSFDVEKGYNRTLTEYNLVAQKIDIIILQNIIKDLKENTLSIKEIAEKYELHSNMITNINQGHSWYNENYDYPIRPQKIKKQYFCKKCGIEISSSSKSGYCVKCSHEFNYKVNHPNREDLKSEIRKETFLSLGKKYGVTDNTVRKWCKSYNLPYKKNEIKKLSDLEWENV